MRVRRVDKKKTRRRHKKIHMSQEKRHKKRHKKRSPGDPLISLHSIIPHSFTHIICLSSLISLEFGLQMTRDLFCWEKETAVEVLSMEGTQRRAKHETKQWTSQKEYERTRGKQVKYQVKRNPTSRCLDKKTWEFSDRTCFSSWAPDK